MHLILHLKKQIYFTDTDDTLGHIAPSVKKGDDAFMKEVFGETVIESKPERICTLGWENQDTPLALGVVPVGVSAANYGYVTENKLHVWTEEEFKKLGVDKPNVFNDVDGFDYEAISDAKPDVIGVTSGTSVAAVFGILFLNLDKGKVSFMAVVCGITVTILIYFIGKGKKFSNDRLILVGIGMQAFLNAVISWMLLKASEYDVKSALRWMSGSLNGIRLGDTPYLLFLLVRLNRKGEKIS